MTLDNFTIPPATLAWAKEQMDKHKDSYLNAMVDKLMTERLYRVTFGTVESLPLQRRAADYLMGQLGPAAKMEVIK